MNESSEPNNASVEESVAEEKVLSKNQRKRKLKAEKWTETKHLKRAAKKDAKKLKKTKLKPASCDDNTDKPKHIEYEGEKMTRQEMKEKGREERLKCCTSNWEVIIDCNWENIHNDRPLTSLAQQLLFCYGANNKSQAPCFIHLTGVGPRLLAQLNKSNLSKWTAVTVSIEEYTYPQYLNKEVIYLTSDAEETLIDLDVTKSYIIGGIVDRNAHKGITYQKAKSQGIKMAKLPIKEHCELTASTVLTVNQIFEIMLRYGETHSWAEAINKVIPLRKQAHSSSSDDQQQQPLESNKVVELTTETAVDRIAND